MAQLDAKQRAGLPDTAFAYIDPHGRRLLPIHDEAHVRNALARFRRVVFEDEAARDLARSRLLKAAKRHGIVPVGFIDGQLRPTARLFTGEVTFLLSDIVSSTTHLARLGDRYQAMLNDLHRLQRAAIRQFGGREVDARADELFVAFAGPRAALDAAVTMQRAIGRHRWPDDRPVEVRIGIHTGRPALTPTGYIGLEVHATARIAAAGHGGQIVVSDAARAAIGQEDRIRLISLGRHRLRGIAEPCELFGAVSPGLLTDFPPLRTEHVEG